MKVRFGMTESEALKLGNKLYDNITSNANNIIKTNDYIEFVRMAIKALEKQIEMKKYCDENDCADCPYHNTSLKDNRCMNDFIIDKE